MASNGSFYVNGIAYGTEDNGLGLVPVRSTPTPAPSSFYQAGTAYGALSNTDALTTLFNASVTATAASATASSTSATASAASAAAAAASAASISSVGALLKSNNLSDLVSVATAKVNLALVKGDVGLGNVDNTSDANKPVSTLQAAADTTVANNAASASALKANIASPALTGVPSAPTATVGTNTTQLATTAFVLANAATAGVTSIAGNNGAFTLTNGVKNNANALSLDVNGLTTDTSPDTTNDFVATYDTSAGTNKKVKLSQLSHKGFFSVYRSGTQTGTAVSYNKIQFNVETVDTANWFDSTTNYRFQPTEAGYYFICVNANTANGSGSDTCEAAVLKNGASFATGVYLNAGGVSSASFYSTVSAVVFLNGSTDYAEGATWLPGGSTSISPGADRTFMFGFKVSE